MADLTTGERGPQGDQGQIGQTGQAGQVGETGQAGQTGQTGRTGQTGQTGQAAQPLGRLQTIVAFVFVVLVFAGLAYRTELNANKIVDNQLRTCALSNLNGTNLNAVLDAFIETAKKSKELPAEEKKMLLTLYMNAKILPIRCA